MQAAFYGVGAAVIGIIALAAGQLAQLALRRDRLQRGIFAVIAAVTGWTESDNGLLFLLCAACWIVQAPPAFRRRTSTAYLSIGPLVVLAQLLWFFVKAGAFVFGSGLAIVPFLYGGVVREHGWLNDRQFLDAIAVAMLTPRASRDHGRVHPLPGRLSPRRPRRGSGRVPVVIAFRWFDRISHNPQVTVFVAGVTAGASGAITHAVIVLACRAVVDGPTALIAAAALGLWWRFKVPEPLLIAGGAVPGLALAGLEGG